MEEQRINETIELINESGDNEGIISLVQAKLDIGLDSLEDLYLTIEQIRNRVANENLPEERKREIFYIFLTSLYSRIISHYLTLDGAVVVSKAIKRHFELMIEQGMEDKFDQFEDKRKR